MKTRKERNEEAREYWSGVAARGEEIIEQRQAQLAAAEGKKSEAETRKEEHTPKRSL